MDLQPVASWSFHNDSWLKLKNKLMVPHVDITANAVLKEINKQICAAKSTCNILISVL